MEQSPAPLVAAVLRALMGPEIQDRAQMVVVAAAVQAFQEELDRTPARCACVAPPAGGRGYVPAALWEYPAVNFRDQGHMSGHGPGTKPRVELLG